ncbi:HNH endonuclease [Janthinobacterium sp. GW460P]|uniref:HNH endonuclease n=1 Tax=unclassified Janthinobacterium TaxID=2610881 RepID=UPI00111BD7F8|nr:MULTISPECIES: HNH endonuclease signature motif containing protein [unclassified Janthinobacterium]MCC7702247.1 HNH endonuclease [Janthinobacterium sp. GW460P]MCC7707755.1 HNH endonuclease [Janthinobacterium sp. GW460W]
MKLIDKPLLDEKIVYDTCINGVNEPERQLRFSTARKDVLNQFQEYQKKAEKFQLFSLPSCLWGKDEQIILNPITKKDFTDLYSTFFASEKSPGRDYYNQIKILAPLGKCPYCGFGHVSTLDHFLPKARYPALSILPANLVPSCSDCNKGKGSPVINRKTQGLHPYFEPENIETDIWLHANLIQTTPLTIEYEIKIPNDWDKDLKKRLKNHFKDFELSKRFSVEAATELASLIDMLDDLDILDDRINHLTRIARIERRVRPNTWRAALYDMLKDNNWYINGGYKNAKKYKIIKRN